MSIQNQNNMEYEHIPQEKFAFAQLDAKLHDTKLETKTRSFFADALLRFKKNKSSVIIYNCSADYLSERYDG